jgi:hypothetical protein
MNNNPKQQAYPLDMVITFLLFLGCLLYALFQNNGLWQAWAGL